MRGEVDNEERQIGRSVERVRDNHINNERRMERVRLPEKDEERNDRRIEVTRNIMDDYNQLTRFVNEMKSAEERQSSLISSRYNVESLKQTEAGNNNNKDWTSSVSLGLVTVAVLVIQHHYNKPSVKVF
jgi:hypothetical protein